MISRSHRFHGHNSLSYVYRNGQTTRGPAFSIKSVMNPRRQTYRAAVVISRKVHKSAIGRNRMRRRLYEAIRQLEPRITEPHDIVLTVFQDSLLEDPPEKLNRQLVSQLRQAGILKSQKPKA